MGELLLKLFVKDYQKTDEPKVRRRYGVFGSVFGLVTNLLLFAMKITVGLLFSSMSIVSDAFNSLSDFGSCFLNLFGSAVSSKPADKDHPYGHERMEYIVSMLIGVIVIVFGVLLFIEGLQKLFNPGEASKEFPLLQAVILAVSAFLKVLQMLLYFYLGKKISSMSLIDSGKDARNDILSTVLVLVGSFVIYYTGFVQTDAILSMLISIYIVVEGFKMLLEAGNALLGEKPDPEKVKEFVGLIKSHPGVYGVHDLEMHSYGPNKLFASVHVEVDGTKDMFSTHEMIDDIEDDCLHRLHIRTVIHMDPILINDPETERVKKIVLESLTEIDPKLSFHDFRISRASNGRELAIFDMVVPAKDNEKKKEVRNKVIASIREKDPSLKPVINLDDEFTMILEEND